MRKKEITDIVTRIEKADKIFFDSLVPSILEDDKKVVYIIFDKDNTEEEALYVGRTKKLRRRLYTNHLHGNKTTARLKKYLVEDNNRFPNIKTIEEAKNYLKENCYFKYLEIKESRDRGQIEGLLSFLFNVYYIEDEH